MLPTWLVKDVAGSKPPLVPDLFTRKESLCRLVWRQSVLSISRELGISDVALGKRCKRLGVKKPPRGYWAKVYALGPVGKPDSPRVMHHTNYLLVSIMVR